MLTTMFRGYFADTPQVYSMCGALYGYGDYAQAMHEDDKMLGDLRAAQELDHMGSVYVHVFNTMYGYYAQDKDARQELLDNLRNDDLHYTADALTGMFKQTDFTTAIGRGMTYDEAREAFGYNTPKDKAAEIRILFAESKDEQKLSTHAKAMNEDFRDLTIAAAPIVLDFFLG